MANTSNLSSFLTDVADAIREKKGTQDQIPAGNFDTEIKSIETGTKINNQDKDITKNGTYTADEGYTGLGTVIVNVPQTGDVPVKLFKTKEEMNSSTGNVEGDLALVYKNEQQNMTADMEVTAITFPETVTLPTAFTGNAYGRLRAVDSSVMFDGNCGLSKTSFGFDSFSHIGMIRASYTSEDGITYTRTSLQGDNPIKLPTVVKGDANEWNDNFGYFMQIGTSVFEGIYIYKNNSWKLAPTQLDAISDYVYKKSFYGKNGLESGALAQNISNSFNDANADIYSKIQLSYNDISPRVLTDSDKSIDNKIFIIPVKLDGTPLLDTSKVTNMDSMFRDCSNLTAIPLLDTSSATDMTSMFYGCTNLTTIPQLDTSNVTNMRNTFASCTNLTTIPQLDTSKVTDMENTFASCTNLTTIPELNTSNVTNMRNTFASCTNLTTIPELNTSNVTNMENTFYGCSSLTTIPQLNTSKVYYMRNTFTGCSNLTTIPQLDTSRVGDMIQMFSDCTNLTTIPQLDISNVEYYMWDMFHNCSSLSDDSLNIIMQMCINATSYTGTKTLKYIGLTSEQATKCTTLSNYSAFTSAGWTTGY